MGCISKIGTNYGVDVNYMNSNLKETEWIPGGCVLHYNKSTIKENFFPFSGKAFCEDLMHSFLLRENSIKLWVCKNSSCKTEHAYFPNQKKEIIQYLEAFKYLQKLRNKRIARFWIWYFLNLLRSQLLSQRPEQKYDLLGWSDPTKRNLIRQSLFHLKVAHHLSAKTPLSLILV